MWLGGRALLPKSPPKDFASTPPLAGLAALAGLTSLATLAALSGLATLRGDLSVKVGQIAFPLGLLRMLRDQPRQNSPAGI